MPHYKRLALAEFKALLGKLTKQLSVMCWCISKHITNISVNIMGIEFSREVSFESRTVILLCTQRTSVCICDSNLCFYDRLDESLLSETKGMPKGYPRLGSPQGSEDVLFMCALFIAVTNHIKRSAASDVAPHTFIINMLAISYCSAFHKTWSITVTWRFLNLQSWLHFTLS